MGFEKRFRKKTGVLSWVVAGGIQRLKNELFRWSWGGRGDSHQSRCSQKLEDGREEIPPGTAKAEFSGDHFLLQRLLASGTVGAAPQYCGGMLAAVSPNWGW